MVQVVPHAGMDTLDPPTHVGIPEIHLRQNQSERGRSLAHDRLDVGPIAAIRGVLVAGHHGPAAEIDAGRGQEELGDAEPEPGQARFIGRVLALEPPWVMS